MAERTFVLKGNVANIKQGIRDMRKELRDLQRVQKDGGKLTDEQKKRVLDLKDGVADLKDESAKYRAELKKSATEERAAIKRKDEMVKSAKAAAVGLVALAAATKRVVQARAEQERVEKELSFAFRRTGQNRVEAMRSMAEAQAFFSEQQSKTIFGDEDQARALEIVLRTTQKTEGAYDLLKTAMDAASSSGKSLEKTTMALARARGGDIEGLERYGLLTGDQVDALNKIDDASHKWTRTLELVESRNKDARLEIGKTSQTLAQLENDAGDLEQALGELAISFGMVGASAVGFGGPQGALADAASKTSTAAKNIILYWNETNKATKAMDGFRIALEFAKGPFSDFNGAADDFTGRLQKIVDKANSAATALDKVRDARPFEESDRTQAGVGLRGKREGLSFKTTQAMAGVEPEKEKKKAKVKPAAEVGYEFSIAERDAVELAAAAKAKAHAEEMDQKREKLDAQIAFNKAQIEEGTQRILINKAVDDDESADKKKEEKKALDLRNAAIESGLGLAESVAGEFIDSEAAKAGISAAIETARAIAAFATPGMQASGIGHAAAAVQFGIAAAMSGSGGGKSSAKPAGGGGKQGSSFNPQNEAGGAVGRDVGRSTSTGPAPVVVNVAFRSVSKPTPEESRVIADAVSDEMRTRA